MAQDPAKKQKVLLSIVVKEGIYGLHVNGQSIMTSELPLGRAELSKDQKSVSVFQLTDNGPQEVVIKLG